MANNTQQVTVQMTKWLYSLPATPIIRDVVDLTYRVFHNFSRHDGSHMAAGVAYYAIFSIFPLALATISIAGILFTASDVKARVLEFLERNVGIGSEELITSNIDSLLDVRGEIGLVAVLTLFWASRAVFGAVHRVMNRAWLVVERPRFWVSQVLQLGAAFGVATLFIVSAMVGPTGRALASRNDTLFGVSIPWSALFTLISLVIAWMLLLLIYRFVPDTKVRWGDAFLSASIATWLFEGAKWGFAFFLSNLSSLDIIYGSVTTIVVLMLFLYIVSILLVFGAELSNAPLHRRKVRHVRAHGSEMADYKVDPVGIVLPISERGRQNATPLATEGD
jgi:membrane protein